MAAGYRPAGDDRYVSRRRWSDLWYVFLGPQPFLLIGLVLPGVARIVVTAALGALILTGAVLETASAGVLLVVRNAETVQRAREFRTVLARLALARAERPATALPQERRREIRAAEIAFINTA